MGVSELCEETDEAESLATLERALDLGINFLDTAPVSTQTRPSRARSALMRGAWQRIRGI